MVVMIGSFSIVTSLAMLVMENQGHSRNDEHGRDPAHDLQDFYPAGLHNRADWHHAWILFRTRGWLAAQALPLHKAA